MTLPAPKIEVIELRCEDNPRRLFAKLRDVTPGTIDTNTNLLEFSCRECMRNRRAQGHPECRVFHRFNLLGELVETVVETL